MIVKMEISSSSDNDVIDNSWLPSDPILNNQQLKQKSNSNDIPKVSELRLLLIAKDTCGVLLDSGHSIPLSTGQKILCGDVCLTFEIINYKTENQSDSQMDDEKNLSSYFSQRINHQNDPISSNSTSVLASKQTDDPLDFLFNKDESNLVSHHTNSKQIMYSEEDLLATDSCFSPPLAILENQHPTAKTNNVLKNAQTNNLIEEKKEGNILIDLGFE